MSFSKLVRLGKDAELAVTPNGKNVCKLVCAYDVGWGDNKKTVWVDASWWGDRGQKVAEYLTKGSQIVLHADDVEPEAWEGKNGIGTKLKMNVTNVELVARPKQEQQPDYRGHPGSNQENPTYSQQSPNNQVPHGSQYQPGQPSSGFGEFDDDIPF